MKITETIQTVCIPIVIRPDELDRLHQNIISKLLTDVKGHCMEDIGYISDVVEIINVKSVGIANKTANANFKVECKLKVIQPKIGEIIEGSVNKLMSDKGLTAINGPLEIFSKWCPEMRDVYEHNVCLFKITQFRHTDTRILCVGDLKGIAPSH